MIVVLLYILGVGAIVISGIAGFSSRSLYGFFVSIVGGATSAVILFALAKILENQGNILHRLQYQEETDRRLRNKEKQVCTKCDHKYDIDHNSCPNCGYRC